MSRNSCPARYGRGVDIQTAEFRFAADPCGSGADGAPTRTEILTWFRPPGHNADDDEDGLMTAELEVPVGSPIDHLAQAVQADPDGSMTQVGEWLRALVASCPCAGYDECPVLSALSLVTAIEQALATPPPA